MVLAFKILIKYCQCFYISIGCVVIISTKASCLALLVPLEAGPSLDVRPDGAGGRVLGAGRGPLLALVPGAPSVIDLVLPYYRLTISKDFSKQYFSITITVFLFCLKAINNAIFMFSMAFFFLCVDFLHTFYICTL